MLHRLTYHIRTWSLSAPTLHGTQRRGHLLGIDGLYFTIDRDRYHSILSHTLFPVVLLMNCTWVVPPKPVGTLPKPNLMYTRQFICIR